MINKYWKITLVLFLGVMISLVGFKYRIRQYSQTPSVSENFDEIGYLWLGKSLLSTGIPANWSALDFYNQYQPANGERVLNYNIGVNDQLPSLNNWSKFKKPTVRSYESTLDNNYKSQFLIVQPYLDNPPLTGIIFAAFDSGKSMAVSTIKQIRLVPIIALSMTIITIFLLGYFLISFNVGLIASLIYCFGPGFVISSRMAVPENLIAFLLPLTLLILYFYQKTKKTKLLITLGIICFIAVWLKVSGLIIPLIIAMICFNQKDFRSGWISIASGALGFLSYVGYCLIYSPTLFIQMITTQGARMFNGPASILASILHPEIPAFLFDGWIILGYISILGIIILKNKNQHFNYFSLSVVGYLIFFMLFGGLNYPWYQFIIYPILAISLGIIIDKFLKKPRFEFNFLFFLTVVSTLLQYSQYTDNWINFLNTYRLLFIILVLVSAVGWFFKRFQKNLLRISLIIMLFLSLYLSTRIINNLNFLWPLLTQNKISIY